MTTPADSAVLERPAAASTTPPEPAGEVLVIERTFDAPRDLVFRAWTDPEHQRRWFAPHNYPLTHHRADIRPGGQWRLCMQSPKNEQHWAAGIYHEIIPNERLVFTHAWDAPCDGEPPRTTLITVTFADAGSGRTRMVFRQAGLPSVASRESHRGGWTEVFEILDTYIAEPSSVEAGAPSAAGDASPATLVLARLFDHPAERVFDAWLDAKAVGRFLFATPDGQMQPVTLDPRVGGQFRITEKRPTYTADHFGTYELIDRPRRLVFTFATDRESAPTRVLIDIAPLAQGCKLTLTHELNAQWQQYRGRATAGWSMILDNLARTLADARPA
jgi:uncharacterized protein YndB with AHSA1/START domain